MKRVWIEITIVLAVALTSAWYSRNHSGSCLLSVYPPYRCEGVTHFTGDLSWSNTGALKNETLFTRWNRSFNSFLGTSGYEDLTRMAAVKHDVDADLIRAVILIESRFRHGAVSPRGAAGLMQLAPATARAFGANNVYDPKENILAGSRYLKHLLKMFHNNTELALAAYNAGPEAVKRFKGIPPYPETRDYVKRVLNIYKTLQTAPKIVA